MLAANQFWVKREYVEPDWRKYLGPDWVPTYEGASTLVCNHSCWTDTCIYIYLCMPSFLAKKSVRNYVGVGPCSIALQSLFVDRSGTKEEKKKVLDDICERQKLSEQGILPPIVIEPEGGTSNGLYVTKFMKGAFFGLNSV
jgi:1-acyl-sn-glycerol-3-phosphate acyltransferase